MIAFRNLIENPTAENYLAIRKEIVALDGYDPYSDDIDQLNELLDAEKFEEALQYNNANTLLSARCHLLKSFALKQLGNDKDAQSENIIAHQILEGMAASGDGTLEKPYMVLRISDERDLMMYLDEEFTSQSLSNRNGMMLDVLTTVSGKQIHFNITDCFIAMQAKRGNFGVEVKKKWWKFW